MLMFSKKMFIGLLSVCTNSSFSRPLASNSKGAIKYVLLND